MNKYEKDFKDITGYEFNKYYLEYCPKLTWYLASRYTKDLDKAKDFANQAFMQALEKISSYNKEKSKLITWLTKIAINLVIKDWKDDHKYNFISLERDTEEAPSLMNILKIEDNSSNIHDEENKKKCEIVYDVINSLPNKYKKVMEMRELEHMAYKDIADTIKKEITITTNKNFLFDNPEDFYNLKLKNLGEKEAFLKFKKEENYIEKIIKPGEEIFITRDDITFEKSGSTIKLECDSVVVGKYITTTNLSTIKSQIKKGRELIQKKSKKRFEIITKNGVV